MLTALLVIIYLAFISLGLPDSLLGSAWPVIQGQLGAPVSFAGILSMIVACGTVVSSLCSSWLIRKFGTGGVTLISVAMTAGALLGYFWAPSAVWLCLFAVPLGLGAGSVDAALNNFVALHYKERHMNWLHCFWGIGATAGPAIMAFWIAKDSQWRIGYLSVGLIQSALVLILLCSLPLWKKIGGRNAAENTNAEAAEVQTAETASVPLRKVLHLPRAKPALLAFFCYCGLEVTAGLWGSSYAVSGYGVSTEVAAGWASLFYLGITLGRLVSGFVSIKLSGTALVRMGEVAIALGVVVLLLPLPVERIPVAFCLIGIGCAPIYPALLHQTPRVFGASLSQSMMGVQMACAYIGSTFMPPLFGLVGQGISLKVLPVFLIVLLLIMTCSSEKVARSMSKAAQSKIEP